MTQMIEELSGLPGSPELSVKEVLSGQEVLGALRNILTDPDKMKNAVYFTREGQEHAVLAGYAEAGRQQVPGANVAVLAPVADNSSVASGGEAEVRIENATYRVNLAAEKESEHGDFVSLDVGDKKKRATISQSGMVLEALQKLWPSYARARSVVVAEQLATDNPVYIVDNAFKNGQPASKSYMKGPARKLY